MCLSLSALYISFVFYYVACDKVLQLNEELFFLSFIEYTHKETALSPHDLQDWKYENLTINPRSSHKPYNFL